MLQLVMDSSVEAPKVNCTVAIFDSHGQIAATHVLTFAAVKKRSSSPVISRSSPILLPDSSLTPPASMHEPPMRDSPIHGEPVYVDPAHNDDNTTGSTNRTAEEPTCIEECGRYNVPCLTRRGCPTGVGNVVGGVTGGLSGVAASVIALPPPVLDKQVVCFMHVPTSRYPTTWWF
jgi:hypothetical protein